MTVWGSIYNSTRAALNTHTLRLAQLQEQIASGARVNRASDDPVDAYRIMGLRAQSGALAEYGKNLDTVTRTLELGHSVMQQISSDLQSLLQQFEQSASATYNQDTRTILGESIDTFVEKFLSLANTSSLGRFIFSGAKSDTQAYVAETDGQYITSVTYQGSMDDLATPVAPAVELPGALVGEKFFYVDDRQRPEFFGDTGAEAGKGTSNVRGDLYLEVTHKATSIVSDPDGSGLAVSASPGVTDTALGRHDLIVDVTQNTIRFASGGPTVTYSGSETSLAVTNADGDVVYVDVTGLNGGLLGPATVTIQSDAYLSIDDDAPAVELTDFTDDNVAVTDSDGRVLYVNGAAVARTGLDPVRVPGTSDLFSTLIHAGQVLRNDRGLSETDQMELVKNSIESLREVIGKITQGMTSLGARLEAMDVLATSIEDIKASADDQAGALENADMVQVSAELARTQTLYQMTLASSAKLLSLSLLDYL